MLEDKVMAKLIKKLPGHSGCHVELYRHANNLYVKKSSSAEEYNRRLRKQMIKQMLFVSNQIFTPKIYTKGYDNNIFWFTMQFVNGQSFSQYIQNVNIKDISIFTQKLFSSLTIDQSKTNFAANQIFQSKINSLLKRADIFTENEKEAFNLLKQYDFSLVPDSPCHGDLTTENILVSSDGRIYLIDFLDSFYNSWMMDIAKLLQDLELFWSYRHQRMSENLKIRLLIMKDYLLNTI